MQHAKFLKMNDKVKQMKNDIHLIKVSIRNQGQKIQENNNDMFKK